MTSGAAARVRALVLKDVAELVRTPGAVIPALAIGVASLIPPFLVAVIAPIVAGETLAESTEFAEGAALAVQIIPEMRGLTGNALVESFVFHQFLLFFMMVPVVGAMAIAAHAIIGEKLARTLEPLLATPITTTELLVAKTMTPFAFSLAVTWATLLVFVSGVATIAEPGVWQSLIGARTLLLFLLIGPLLAVASLLMAVIVSSRVNDPRTAQQLAALVILPITAAFVAQLTGQFVIGFRALLASAIALLILDAALLWVGARVFDRERILMRWK